MQVDERDLLLVFKALSLVSSPFIPYILQLHLQVKSSAAFSKPLPLKNVDQSGNFLKQNDGTTIFCFIHID